MKLNAIEYVHKNFDPQIISTKFVSTVNSIFTKQKLKKKLKVPFIEKVCPEPLFRVLKLINTKLKYRS